MRRYIMRVPGGETKALEKQKPGFAAGREKYCCFQSDYYCSFCCFYMWVMFVPTNMNVKQKVTGLLRIYEQLKL